jgi:DegV family protein with EDD domain
MDTVAILTDSSARIPRTTHRLMVVPVLIHLGGEVLRGDSPGVAGRVYEALRRDEPVKSSAPSVIEYVAAIERAPARSVVVITPASEFTGMFRNALVAAELSGRQVHVVDSRTAAAAHGLVVLEAVRIAEAGGSMERVVAAAADAAQRAELVATLDNLEYVRRSGRLPAAAIDVAWVLGERPVFRLRQGLVERLALERSGESALERVMHEATQRAIATATNRVVFHAADPERAARLQRELEVSDVTEFSPSMGIHTGPGVVGIAWLAGREGSHSSS